MSEEWHKTHAVLLKSVAEAQGKLLAGINALEGQIKGLGDGLVDEIRKLCEAQIQVVEGNTVIAKKMDEWIGVWNKLAKFGAKAPSTKRKPRGRKGGK
jgi:hypothetical protein